jgi:LysM repeat protein
VKSGDTLIALAKQVNRTAEELMQANCLTSPTIRVGTTLYLPLESCAIAPPEDWSPYTVHSGDTLFSLASARNTTVAEVKRVNCLVSDSLDVGKQLYLPPAPPASPAPVAPVPAVRPQAPPIPLDNNNGVTLPSEVFLGQGGGGVGDLCGYTPSVLPVVKVERLSYERGDQFFLCLYGFQNDEDLTVIFYTDRQTLGSDILHVTADGNVVSVQSGVSAGFAYGSAAPGTVELHPWLPLNLPDPVYVQVNTANKVARQVIRNIDLGRRVGFSQTGQYTLFADRPRCLEVNAGTTLQFLGASFAPWQRIPIGLYISRDDPFSSVGITLTLSASGQVTTDGNGRFQFPIVVGPTDQRGTYIVVPVTDSSIAEVTVNQEIDCYKLQ